MRRALSRCWNARFRRFRIRFRYALKPLLLDLRTSHPLPPPMRTMGVCLVSDTHTTLLGVLNIGSATGVERAEIGYR